MPLPLLVSAQQVGKVRRIWEASCHLRALSAQTLTQKLRHHETQNKGVKNLVGLGPSASLVRPDIYRKASQPSVRKSADTHQCQSRHHLLSTTSYSKHRCMCCDIFRICWLETIRRRRTGGTGFINSGHISQQVARIAKPETVLKLTSTSHVTDNLAWFWYDTIHCAVWW